MEPYTVLGGSGRPLQSDILLHPGEILSMEIEARDIKKSEFAAAIGIKPGNLTELLKGKRHISAVMALKIEALLEIDAAFWLRVQSDYDLGLAKRELPKHLHSTLLKKRHTFKKKEIKIALD